MALSEYTVKRTTVEFPGGSFEVRGISLPDVAMLIGVHEHVISDIVTMAQSKAELFNSGEVTAITDLLSEFIRESPILIGNIICICADEPSEMEKAMSLPVTTQVDALTKIADLTFTDLASVKKLAAGVMKLIRGIVPPATARSAGK